jgi:hypothetical protein
VVVVLIVGRAGTAGGPGGHCKGEDDQAVLVHGRVVVLWFLEVTDHRSWP